MTGSEMMPQGEQTQRVLCKEGQAKTGNVRDGSGITVAD